MIKKLRAKFVLMTMASLLLVLCIIIGAVNALNYRNIVDEADSILAVLAENGGTFPQMPGPGGAPGPHKREFSPEVPFESRYFTVNLDTSGAVLRADLGKIAAVDADTAAAYAGHVWKSGDGQGFVGNYRFIRCETGTGSIVIFLDCGRSLFTFRTFLLYSCGISLLGVLTVLILLMVFSRRIIKPVSESYEKQRQFITDAGHELKTPLTVIDADAELLLMDYGENEWIRDIRAQTKHLAALTNDLIILSRLEEDRPQRQMIEFPFSDMVEELVQSFQALAKVQGKTFTGRICPMLSLRGDPESLRQLLSILLDNALKYSDGGGMIELCLDRQGKNLRLSVSNTTPAPIPQEQLGHMFDRFYRGDQSRNSQNGGYGIGLSIAKAVVQAHRGKISASTWGERGLQLVVALPMQ